MSSWRKLPHEVVVGNVYFNGQPFYTTTLESVNRELKTGFDRSTPANAHMWIELPDHTVFDPSFRATLAKRVGRRIKWNELIHIGSTTAAWRGHSLRYAPFLRGLIYYRTVVTPGGDDGPLDALTKLHGEHWQAALDKLNKATP